MNDLNQDLLFSVHFIGLKLKKVVTKYVIGVENNSSDREETYSVCNEIN